MPTFEISVDFDVYCSCGAALCGQSRVSRTRGAWQVVIEPCDTCKDAALQDGYESGYNEGYAKGVDDI